MPAQWAGYIRPTMRPLSEAYSQGIEELRDFIADFRRSPDDWDDLLHSIIDDPDIIQAVKDHKPR